MDAATEEEGRTFMAMLSLAGGDRERVAKHYAAELEGKGLKVERTAVDTAAMKAIALVGRGEGGREMTVTVTEQAEQPLQIVLVAKSGKP